MASKYEVLASLIDAANFTDEYGLTGNIKSALQTMHEFDDLLGETERVAIDCVFESLAEGWVTVDFSKRSGDA